MGDGSGGAALVVAVYAALTYDVISATNSSPQTTEINASVRSDTLMKWVYMGLGQALIFVIIGMYFQHTEKKPVWLPAIGGFLAGILLYAQYIHARESGLRNGGPSTEVLGGYG